jgi:hypothetical protein
MNGQEEKSEGSKSKEGSPAKKGSSGRENGSGHEEELIRHKDFSSWNREMRDQIDPETGERTQLLTKRQFRELLRKQLREF